MKLLWKEWQQQKWIALCGLFAGVLFPAFDCLIQWNQRDIYIATEAGSYFLLFTGAAFAVILAIASMHHETRKGVDAFLLSKPVNLRCFYATKFILAACLLGVVFLGTISIDSITQLYSLYRGRSSRWIGVSEISAIFHYTYPVALLLFAAGVFYMTVVRDTARAAFLAMWTALLLYFLPLVVAQLHWMSVFEQTENYQNSILSYLFDLYPYRQDESFTVWLRDALWQYQWNHFWDYLSFLAVTLLGAIGFVGLSVKAERYHWRWRPQQKSIVWTMGVSAAAIFALALLQIGHNLKPAEEFNGKPLVNPVHYDWSEYIDPLEEKYFLSMRFRSEESRLCVKDELMFQAVVGYQADDENNIHDREGIVHFILQVNRFPYVQNPDSDTEDGLASDLLAGATRFFQTEPGADVWLQSIIGSYIREDRLYTAYRPRYIREPDAEDKYHYPGDLNPMYLVTFDISEPTRPTVLSNMEISRSNFIAPTMGGTDEFCYIDDGPQLIVISLKEPDNPQVIRRIDIDDEEAFVTESWQVSLEQEGRFWTPQRWLVVWQDRLLYSDYRRIRIMDISDRLNPRTICDEALYGRYFHDDIRAVYLKDDRLYTSTKNGIYIFELQPDNDGVYTSRLIGHRRATTLEKLASRTPRELLLQGNYLIEQAGGFGILV